VGDLLGQVLVGVAADAELAGLVLSQAPRFVAAGQFG
jgi:hypothetical protein